MRLRDGILVALACGAAAGIGAVAAETADVIVNYEVTEIDSIDTNVELVTLVLDSAIAGVGLDVELDETTVTYSITTNAPPDSRKITAFISPGTSPFVYLGLQIERPSPECTPVSLGLGTDPADLMLGIGAVMRTGLWMVFELWADVQAGVIPPSSTTLTLTLVEA